jgi:hypothetical protein
MNALAEQYLDPNRASVFIMVPRALEEKIPR